jgi:hypothetical protein
MRNSSLPQFGEGAGVKTGRLASARISSEMTPAAVSDAKR